MKAGERVLVIAGDHAGRIGIVSDVAMRAAAIRSLLLPSPMRSLLLGRLEVAAGCVVVEFGTESPCVFRADDIEIATS